MSDVVLRCGKCNRTLARVEAVEPESWKDTFYVPRCSCEVPDARRIVGYMIRRGTDGVPLGGEAPLWAIFEEVGKAIAKGKDIGVSVRFSEQPDGLHLHLK